MNSPAYLSDFHECQFCQSLVIDPDESVVSTRDPVLLFDITLQDVLEATECCPLASWLCAEWSGPRTDSMWGRRIETYDWDELLSQSTKLFVCMYVVFREAFEEIRWVGLIASRKGLVSERKGYTTWNYPIKQSGSLMLFTVPGMCTDIFPEQVVMPTD